ncbi:MAG TPA: hypothetical protein VFQ84_05150 [Arenimonas sp.]|uniref:hypothetical protein n=1 Tax=Arenimonas sp. TaxID=1872635 RepID=UPI002D7E4B5A|nr:hypothetical protein [Arenimonas sp.]HEU0152715.1 hypothetical protein [Arenimonas sp.]
MRNLDRAVTAIGALDLAHVAWVVAGTLLGAGFSSIWQGISSFGLPLPWLQAAALLAVYLAILACGFSLLLRRTALVWLNYVLFPLRVLFALPTLFPLFIALGRLNMDPWITFLLLAATETARIILVRKWERRVMSPPTHGAAA